MRPYPSLADDKLKSIYEALQYIVRERDKDVLEFNNQNNIYVRGRKVNKIPTSSADVVVPTDRVGDVSITPTYIYYLVDNSGVAEWRRVALSTF